MSQEYRIAWVGNQVREWNGKHGSFIDYKVAFDGREGTVTWARKHDSDAPTVGLSVYGSIIEEEVNPRSGDPFTVYKFKSEQRDDGVPAIRQPSQSRVNAPTSTAGSANGQSSFDSRSLRIERQHSQEMAIRVVALDKSGANLLSGDASALKRVVGDWTDYFMDDLDSYEKVRRFANVKPEPTLEQAVADGTVPTEPVKTPADDDPFADLELD